MSSSSKQSICRTKAMLASWPVSNFSVSGSMWSPGLKLISSYVVVVASLQVLLN